MKKIILSVILLSVFISLKGQEFLRAKNNDDVIYFVRDSFNGAARNFKIFDGKKLIGIFAGRHAYMIYNCKPGKHLFTFSVSQERGDFVTANLEKGKTYIVNIKPGYGKLSPYFINASNKKELKSMWKVIGKHPPVSLTKVKSQKYQYKYNYFIYNELKVYHKKINKGKNFQQKVKGYEIPDQYLAR